MEACTSLPAPPGQQWHLLYNSCPWRARPLNIFFLSVTDLQTLQTWSHLPFPNCPEEKVLTRFRMQTLLNGSWWFYFQSDLQRRARQSLLMCLKFDRAAIIFLGLSSVSWLWLLGEMFHQCQVICMFVCVCDELNMEAALGSSEHCSIHRPVGETKITQQKQQILKHSASICFRSAGSSEEESLMSWSTAVFPLFPKSRDVYRRQTTEPSAFQKSIDMWHVWFQI